MEPLPPGTTYPLKEWERQDKLNVELVGYGWEEKRVIVRFHLPKDRDVGRIQLAITFMCRDVKHSKNWMCEYCGASARETHIVTNSWHHLEPPKLVVYIHYVCDMDQRHVLDGLRMTHDMHNLANMGRLGPFPTSFPPKQPGVTYPLAGSCACCERDETANDPGNLKKCSQCKLTRYCSNECQKKDWPRHKVTCNKIFSVKFENWE
ncbi:hypothetical protein K466DRAFT_481374 [Polyporus arcularius HHB13444]|uniref:MYND-type domain-containing protein n=2 Tax=Polyporaceae TaxID=5317 RepID=A0A5C3Q100_9APHY|nr:hypothetical protein OH76DRAFT_1395813 [Polyporus brumalis]TFK92133.1 hypothetical protein K466DRAFT_481374 [Polyporus arcularius HHB13444]